MLRVLKRIVTFILSCLIASPRFKGIVNDRAKRIIEIINEVVIMPDVQPASPTWNGQTHWDEAKQNPITWCNRALHRMLERLGGEAALLLESRGIGWTNANAMVRNARGRLEEIADGKTAQDMANNGGLVVAAAENAAGGSGHVALVCPDTYPYDDSNGPLVGQAGLENGIMPARQGFGQRLFSNIEYYLIPYAESCGG